ncbi:MFS transporter [Streptomyces desertarenae]|uniref:MFS transporter n=1 Tax=Streptomyces desertarenae TaxID=2666184 RepID=A0ABW4PLU0_9ACTN
MSRAEAGNERHRAAVSGGILPRGPGVGWFGAAGFVNALGTGFFYPFSLLFFTGVSGLPMSTVGVVLTATALAALPGLFAVGRLVDRFGPRSVIIVSALVRGGCFVGFVSMPGLVPLALCSVVLALGNRAEQAAAPLLAVGLAAEGQGSRWLALSRVVFNAGVGAGALLAGLLIVDTASGFVLLGVINAAGFLLAAVLYFKVPAAVADRRSAARRPSRRHDRPWRDLLFLRVAGANALLWMAALVMESALPVFVLRELDLPSWTVGALFAVNTALLVLLQLPVSRVLDRFRPGPVLAFGGLSYIVLYVGAALASSAPQHVRSAVLIGAMAVYTLGEMAVSQAGLVLLTGIPPKRSQGSYLAFNQVFIGTATAFVPLISTSALESRPAVLWWVLTGVSVTAAALAVRCRPRGDGEAGAPGGGGGASEQRRGTTV